MLVKNGVLLKTVTFKDVKGYAYRLYPSTYKHIRLHHPEIKDPIGFARFVFKNTFAIYESKKDKRIYLYYAGKKYYRVVVADIIDRKIKTMYNSDKIKKGKVSWIDKSNLIN